MLVNLSSPLQTSEELRLSATHGSIVLTAGVYRQTWISGYMLFVDIHIRNGSNKTVNKVEVQLQKATIVYSYPAASTEGGPASSLRVPDHCDKDILARSIMKGPRDTVPPHSESTRTCRLEVPSGLASIDTGMTTISHLPQNRDRCDGLRRSPLIYLLYIPLPFTIHIFPRRVFFLSCCMTSQELTTGAIFATRELGISSKEWLIRNSVLFELWEKIDETSEGEVC